MRHGTTACLRRWTWPEGAVIAQHYQRHWHQEFLPSLRLIDITIPDGLDRHLICDNYAAYKTSENSELAAALPVVSLALHAHRRALH
jgi:hypothetical protein